VVELYTNRVFILKSQRHSSKKGLIARVREKVEIGHEKIKLAVFDSSILEAKQLNDKMLCDIL